MLTMRTGKETILAHKHLFLHFDGSCEPKNPGGVACAGWVLFGDDPEMPPLPLAEEYQVVAEGPGATNNFAEYCGLGLGLKFLCDLGWRGELDVQGDSQLVICQTLGKWQCNKEHLQRLRTRVYQRLVELGLARAHVDGDEAKQYLYDGENLPDSGLDIPVEIDHNMLHLVWVPRELNEYADALTGKAYAEHTGKQQPSRSHGKKKRKK